MKKLMTFILAAFLVTGSLSVAVKAAPENIAASRTWKFSAFGQGIKSSKNSYTGSVANNDLKIVSSSGKIVPASTDGLAFYYTTLNAKTENFTLSADITVDEWTYSNGQEGFGMMVCDAVAKDGASAVFWNNSYMATVTKVGFKWDTSKNEASTTTGTSYSMQLGVGAQEKIGATPANIATGNPLEYGFTSTMWPLDISPITKSLGGGTYNIVGNCTNLESLSLRATAVEPLKTTFHLEIQRNNTGYFLTYTDEAGNSRTQTFYHGSDGDELTKIDENNIYAGFYASRNAAISVKNVELTIIHPDDDAPAESRPVTLVEPSYRVISNKISNTENYELVFYANADGKVSVQGPDGTVAANADVTANTKKRFNVSLDKGSNLYTVTFTPNSDYKPGEYSELSTYESKTFTHTVTYKTYEGDVLYVSPNGSASAAGTKEAPMDIYTALVCPAPGQKIYIMEGTYNLSATVKVARGINGTRDAYIYLQADPEAKSRPVFDFGGNCAGMAFGGDYWKLSGFDVTKSAPGSTGMQVSGDYMIVEDVDTYRNGNTGIQISRADSRDTFEDWPSNNLILNCTSYLNADPGYEDADGFAAKITCGEGNVFDGCIAAYNADDGWDLFAKIESGTIGVVTIRNSIAFKNGYDLDENYNEINAGNGNGFKMGGSGMSGYHVLENSIAFANKAKGIDSNSCPDIQVKNSTSFNNGGSNVVLSGGVDQTDYSAEGIISFKDANGNTTGETIKLRGNQDENKVYRTSNYYFPDGNTNGVKAASNWFVNLDTDAAIHGGITRYADGSINMNGYLELTDEAPENAGARLVAKEEVLQGVQQAPDGNYYYYTDGVVDTTKDGLINYGEWGKYIYLEDGKWVKDKVLYADYAGGKFLVDGGEIAAAVNGLHQDPINTDTWYFLSAGQVQSHVTDLVQYDGAWFYLENGIKANNYNDFVDYNGGKFLVAGGQLQSHVNDLYLHSDGNWYYLSGGQVHTGYTGLVYYAGGWFYVVNGVMDTTYTGWVEYSGQQFYVENGAVVQ